MYSRYQDQFINFQKTVEVAPKIIYLGTRSILDAQNTNQDFMYNIGFLLIRNPIFVNISVLYKGVKV